MKILGASPANTSYYPMPKYKSGVAPLYDTLELSMCSMPKLKNEPRLDKVSEAKAKLNLGTLITDAVIEAIADRIADSIFPTRK